MQLVFKRSHLRKKNTFIFLSRFVRLLWNEPTLFSTTVGPILLNIARQCRCHASLKSVVPAAQIRVWLENAVSHWDDIRDSHDNAFGTGQTMNPLGSPFSHPTHTSRCLCVFQNNPASTGTFGCVSVSLGALTQADTAIFDSSHGTRCSWQSVDTYSMQITRFGSKTWVWARFAHSGWMITCTTTAKYFDKAHGISTRSEKSGSDHGGL